MSALAMPYAIGSQLVRMNRGGLGETSTQITQAITAPVLGAGSVLGAAAVTTGVTAASLATAGITAGVGLIAAAVTLWLNRAGPKQNVATTGIVNQAEPLLQQNLAAWQSSNKTCADLTTCVSNFQQVWNAVVAACCQTSLGDPGHSCMDDRTPSGVTFTCYPGQFHIVGDGMYDWFAYYLLPIINDPEIPAGCCPPQACYDPNCQSPVSMPACTPSAAGAVSSVLGSVSSLAGIPSSWLLMAAAALLLLWVVS